MIYEYTGRVVDIKKRQKKETERKYGEKKEERCAARCCKTHKMKSASLVSKKRVRTQNKEIIHLNRQILKLSNKMNFYILSLKHIYY